jgi:hypothetical protein
MLGSIIDLVVSGVKKMCDWVGSIFGFVKKDIKAMKLPNTPQGVQEYYDKQIDELNRAAKNASGRSSLEAKKMYNSQIEKLKKEKEEELKKMGTGSKLPATTNTTTVPAPTPNPPSTEKLRPSTTSIKIETPNEDKNWEQQNYLLEKSLKYLEIMAEKETKFQPNNITNSSPMSNESVSIVQQKSSRKYNYFNSLLPSTSLAGGSQYA